jgi:hypothetical protein
VRAGYRAVAPPSTALSSSELDQHRKVAVAVADTSKGLHVAKTRDGYEDREGMVQISHFLAYALYLRERDHMKHWRCFIQILTAYHQASQTSRIYTLACSKRNEIGFVTFFLESA